MREIKFRAWTGDKMLYLNHHAFTIDWDLVFATGGLNASYIDTYFEGDKAELMQYTGLKDKNGKEIYEGDIIEFDRREWGGDDNIHIVSWDTDEGAWSWGGGGGTPDMCYRKVIGNIYENPELLK